MDNRYCVYIHSDSLGNVVYVGSGSNQRSKSKEGRTKQHLAMWEHLTINIIEQNLTKHEAINKELELFNIYKNNGYILNIREPVNNLIMDWEYFDKFLYIDTSSSTGLRWKIETGARNKINRRGPGDEAGSLTTSGHYNTKVKGTLYRNQRIIYVLHNKVKLDSIFPVYFKDGNKSNLDPANLVLVENNTNTLKRGTRVCKESGTRGIKWSSNGTGCWYWIVSWKEDFKDKFKCLNPTTEFPNLPYEEAKQRTLDIAIKLRKEKESMHYNTI